MCSLLNTLILFVVICLCESQLFLTPKLPIWRMLDRSHDSGERVLLSEFIDTGNDYTARQLSRVNDKYFLGVTSYSGYLTVNEEHNSNLFFWFFPKEGTEHLYQDDDQEYEYDDDSDLDRMRNKSISDNSDDTPVVLWLQGGPGSSSLFGLFTENGPFFVNSDGYSIKNNPYSWHMKYNLIFIDNPVGTGFSFTDVDGYCQNITQVATQLYSGISQFFKLFPWLESNPFYITGESFAGKYIPAIGYEIFERNKIEDFKINLQGLALGNALSDPYNMLNYADYTYQTGLVDEHGWKEMKIFEYLAKEFIDEIEGKIYWDAQLYTFLLHSNFTNVYNILESNVLEFDTYLKFMNLPHIRKAVHVGNQEFSPPGLVYVNLTPDFMTTAMHWTEHLLNEGMKIMYYRTYWAFHELRCASLSINVNQSGISFYKGGNMDVIVAYPLSEEAFKQMKWKGADLYRKSHRSPFYVNDTLHGYIKKAENFYDVLILNAGHMVPTDQPQAALELLDRFIRNDL